MGTDFFALQLKDWLTLAVLVVTCFAVYWGPIAAIKVSKKLDAAALLQRQRTEIFAQLMKTRRFKLDTDHVSALNLIQVFFHGEPKILDAYKSYITLLYRRAEGKDPIDALIKERDDSFIDLAHKIASSLGYNLDKKEVEDLAYSPAGWADDQNTVRKLHLLFIELLENRRLLGVTNVVNAGGMFPPPPAP